MWCGGRCTIRRWCDVDAPAPAEPFPITRVAHLPAERTAPGWLVEGLWGEHAVGFIGGTPKSGKTWLALELAVAVASGRHCLGRFRVPQAGRVLLFAAEDTAADVRHRVAGLSDARRVDLERLPIGLITEPVLQLDRPGHQDRLAATLDKVRPRLLILDPLVRLHRGDENSAADTSALLGFLRGLQRQMDVAIVVVHHVRKGATGGQPGQALRGSGDLHAWSDSNLFVLHRDGGLQLHVEHRNHPAPEPMGVELRTDPAHLAVTTLSAEPDAANGLRQRVLWALTAESSTRSALRQRLRVRNETLGRVLTELLTEGRVRRVDGRLTVPGSAP